MTDSKHFSCGDDILLLRATRDAAPWQAARVMDAWDALARRLGALLYFPRDKDARAIRTRFHLLLKKHRANKLGSMRTTGDPDELVQRELLLRDVDATLRAHDLSKRSGRGDNDNDSDNDNDNAPSETTSDDHRVSVQHSKKRRRSDVNADDESLMRHLAARNDRALTLLERVVEQQQQQITLQREQIEKQLAMQQQQMQVMMELMDRVTRH